MSREVRRVPLDFNWPLHEVWEGYLRPDSFDGTPCPDCHVLNHYGERQPGHGSTAAAKWVEAALYLIGMMAEDVRSQQFEGTVDQFTRFGDDRSKLHPYLATLQSINVYEHRRPSADIVDLVTGVTGRPRVSFGTGSDFAWKTMKLLGEAAGLPEWGICPTCEGYGTVEAHPGQRAEAEAWEATEPPTGEGWQVWETVSEGSPVTSVFATADELITWLCTYPLGGIYDTPLDREHATAFVNAGFSVGSFVVRSSPDGVEMIDGVSAVHELGKTS